MEGEEGDRWKRSEFRGVGTGREVKKEEME